MIVATAALSTVTPNDEAAQENPKNDGIEIENPSWAESMVPEPDQFAADATDGTTDTHNANTTPKGDNIFFRAIVNTSNTPAIRPR